MSTTARKQQPPRSTPVSGGPQGLRCPASSTPRRTPQAPRQASSGSTSTRRASQSSDTLEVHPKKPARLRAVVKMASALLAEKDAAARRCNVNGDDESDDADGDDMEGASSTSPQQNTNDDDATFSERLCEHEPVRRPPEVEVRPLITPFVHLCMSPFPNRPHSIAFLPADSPWEGDPQASMSSAYVVPCSLDPLPNAVGIRKRIGRKKKYGDLVYSIPQGSVRFSSVIAIFGTAGFREAQDLDTLLPPHLVPRTSDDSDGDDDSNPTTSAPSKGQLTLSDSVDAKKWSIRWTKRVEPDEYRLLHPLQRVNHFPGTWGIGRKDNLHRHLTKAAQVHNTDGNAWYDFHPDAWILPQDAGSLQRDMQRRAHCPVGMDRNVYIVKQVASACGRQMRLLCKGSVPKGKWIVQRYVHNPLLIYGYKFDLRLYVVVTSYLPLKIYVYDEGLVRFATTPYPVADEATKCNMKIKSVTAHLTNYSVNKNNTEAFVNPTDDGADDEKGSKWVLTTVKRYFKSRGLPWDSVWARIEALIIKTILSVEQEVVQQLRTYQGIRPQGYSNCFELYGFDVLICNEASNLKPVLMEVNIMPSLSTRCSLLDQRVKANMIADMLTLVGGYSMEKYGRQFAGSQSVGWAPTGSSISSRRSSAVPNGSISMPPESRHPFLEGLNPHEFEAVCQAEEEYLRRGHFQRIFPTPTAHDIYKPLFTEVKSLNTLLCQWEKARLHEPPIWTQCVSSAPDASGGGASDGEGVE